MNYIKNLTIVGFKKFKTFKIEFNEHLNILVGENEAGKSTILEAISIVLNQQYRNVDKSILSDFFNADNISEFKANPSVKTLPKILIELELELDSQKKDADFFHGEVYGELKSQQEKYGIRFECKFNDEFEDELIDSILEGKIPYEYYDLSWTTFANRSYQLFKRPLNFISIDTTNYGTSASFNLYNKALFNSKYDDRSRIKAKNLFRENLANAFNMLGLGKIDEKRSFGIDNKKIILESVLSVYENTIPLENKGSGMESLIKTKIALDKKSGLDVILIEEPENHLCFSVLRKMLKEISDKQDASQIIVTTHSNMIATRLNLNNVIWINDSISKSLKSVNKKIADFFVKVADNSFLQLLLSKKAVLVEGATEYMMFPYFYEQQIGQNIDNDEITIIPCNGISYKNYLEIARCANKKTAVITDNDGKQNRIDEAKKFNLENIKDDQQIFIPENIDEFTWEVCIYNINDSILNKLIKVQKGAKYPYLNKVNDQEPVLGKMLNNKLESAYIMLTSGENFIAPKYIKDAIEWINKN